MTAGKRRKVRELEQALELLFTTEPAQPFEEERIKQEIDGLRKKLIVLRLLIRLIYGIRTTSVAHNHQAKRLCFV